MTPAETAYAAARGDLPELTGADRAEALDAFLPRYRNVTEWAIAYAINNWIVAGIDRE